MKVRIGRKDLAVYEVVKRFELDLLEFADEATPAIAFVIEILKSTEDNGKFSAKVYRRDSYSISPSNYSERKVMQYSDEVLTVEDNSWHGLTADSSDAMLQKVLDTIENQLGGDGTQ